MKKLALLVFVLLFLMACTKYARLYPVNDLASTTGVLKAKYIESGTGYGEITIASANRILAGLEAINGITLIGWSTAFMFAIFQELMKEGLKKKHK